MASTRDWLAKAAAKRADKAALGGREGRTRPRRALAPGEAAGRRYPGYAPLVLAGLLIIGAAAVAVVLVRRGRRDDTGPEDAAPPTDPSSAPSPGEGPGPRADTPGPSPGGGIEERVRARIEEDPRTKDLPPVRVEIDDGMAWIDGDVPSREGKEALTEVVGSVEGVNIVVNRVVAGRP